MRIELEIPLTLSEISNAASGKLMTSERTVKAICTHSGLLRKNDLFVALQGEISSGEFYVDEAKKKGALVLSGSSPLADILCPNTEKALLSIGKLYKSKLPFLKTTVAITGSVGKTTTKNITAAMLSKKYKAHATHGNYNNAIGVAYTLLSAPKDVEALVIEMGMNHKGEISLLSKAATPDVSVITNVGTAHIGYLGTREAIADAKLEILDGMKYPMLIAPYEEALLRKVDNLYTYSLKNSATNCYMEVLREDADMSLFDVHTKSFYLKAGRVDLPGRHILEAIACGISVMDVLKAEPEFIEAGIRALDKSCVRHSIHKVLDFYIYDDSYNSSPEAVISAFKSPVFRTRPHSCVLGDMLELGEKSEHLHRKIGRAAAKYGFERIYAYGKYAESIADGAIAEGMDPECIFVSADANTPERTAEFILHHHKPNEMILFKASHAMRADRIKDALLELTK